MVGQTCTRGVDLEFKNYIPKILEYNLFSIKALNPHKYETALQNYRKMLLNPKHNSEQEALTGAVEQNSLENTIRKYLLKTVGNNLYGRNSYTKRNSLIDPRTHHIGPDGIILDMAGHPTGLKMNPLGKITPL
jgi:hypothetical protein